MFEAPYGAFLLWGSSFRFMFNYRKVESFFVINNASTLSKDTIEASVKNGMYPLMQPLRGV